MTPDIDDRLISARAVTQSAIQALVAASFAPPTPPPPILGGLVGLAGTELTAIDNLITAAALQPVPPNNFDALVAVLLAVNTGIGAIQQRWHFNVVVPFPAANPAEDPRVRDARIEVESAGAALREIFRDLSMLQGASGGTAALIGINDGVESISAYPMITTEVTTTSVGGGVFSAPTDIGQQVDAAFREIIGRVPRADDSRTLETSLANTFNINDDGGKRVITWRPRTYGGQTQLGGGVTGSQASLFARAKDAADTIIPLLGTLEPVLADADPQEVAAARSMVINQFEAVLDEFATEGGPTVDRVNRLLNTLLVDPVLSTAGGTIVGGLVGLLGYTYGFVDSFGLPLTQLINTLLEEEQHSTYLLISDYIKSVQSSWNTFNSALNNDFGTRLVLLSRALQVAGESVDEVLRAMDSVYFGSAERAVTQFDTSSATGVQNTKMLVSELLSWAQRFALEDAPILVREGGRRGLGPVIADAARINKLLAALLRNLNDPSLPAGIRQTRVQNPLRELSTYLARAEQLAESIR